MKRTFALLEATLAVLAWGASFVSTKVALQDISPAGVVWLRFALGVIILGIAVGLRGQFQLPKAGDLGYFALIGFLGITFHQWLQSTALQTTQANTAAWIVAAAPVFMAILGFAALREKLSFRQIAGIALAAFGVLILVTNGDFRVLLSGGSGNTGDILMLISAMNWAVFSALSRRGLKEHPATRMMFFVMLFGWLLSTPLFAWQSGFHEIAQLSQAGWLSVAFLGIFCSGLAYIFWYDALQTLSMAETGAFLYLEPFVTLVVAAVVLSELITPVALMGGFAILIGVWLVQATTVWRPRRRYLRRS